MQIAWKDYLERNRELGYTTLFGEPVVLHCHHFNLFLDQTVEDPPYVPGRRILFQNAYEASYCLLSRAREALNLQAPEAMIQAFLDLFSYLGQGKLVFASREGNEATFKGISHYSTGWVSKYRGRMHRDRGVDYFARGYVAALWDIAHDHPPGTSTAEETATPVLGDPELVLLVRPSDRPMDVRACLGAGAWERINEPTAPPSLPTPSGLDLETFTHNLSEIADGLVGDERGLIEGFRVYVTRHLARYYAGISADFYLAILKTNRDMAPTAAELLEESGHVCVFNTFSNLLLDPDIRSMAGGLPEPEHFVFATAAVAQALGFGDWRVVEFAPGEHLSLATTTEYEGCLFSRWENGEELPIFFMPGATAAAMNMAYVAKVHEGPDLTQEFYDRLMLGAMGPLFHSSIQALCHRGDPYTRTRASR